MKGKGLLIISFLCLAWTTSPAQTFPCDGSLLFLSNSGSENSTLNKVFFGSFGSLSFGQIKYYSGGNYKGLGFNSVDNYIYAVRDSTNEIVRLKADNTTEVLRTAPNIDVIHTSAGDCSPQGLYYVHDQVLDQILVFGVVERADFFSQFNLVWHPDAEFEGPFTARLDDLAIDPNNPRIAYSFQGAYQDDDLEPVETQGYLLEINIDHQSPDLGQVRPIAPVNDEDIVKMGSLMFSSTGVLHAYGTRSRNRDARQKTLMTINQFTGEVFPFGITGPISSSTDGCSCPFNLTFTNAVNPNFALCTDSKLTYTLRVDNRTFEDILSARMKDTFPEGMLITQIRGEFTGMMKPGTGEGTRILAIDNLVIPARSSIQIDVDLDVIDLPIEIVSNQAVLSNLPDKFPGDLVSDNPITLGALGDPTSIFSDPQRLQNFEIEVSNATTCINAIDGSIKIKAPVFIPSIEYEVHLVDQEFNAIYKDVTVDNENTILLDSLAPGEYRIKAITPITSQCSFAMKDTSVTIEAPNHLVSADIFSNAPICEGQALDFFIEVDPPGGDLEWGGPNWFYATESDLSVDSARFEQSGFYEVTYTYGACEQIREIDLEIYPTINAEMEGALQYCERDTIQLLAKGEGPNHQYSWTGPRAVNNTLEWNLPSARKEDEGWYELIIDNGSCADTVSQYVEILPTPSLELPSRILSTFCEPLPILPQLSGDRNVNYSWTPSEGLTCTDCLEPFVLKPLQRSYQLQVLNNLGCRDSAEVMIALDVENLITIPNIFSPNNDGANDDFEIFFNCGVESIEEFKIFDRFGGLVYDLPFTDSLNDANLFWDGRVGGQSSKPGVYIWKKKIKMINGMTQRLMGDVTLVH